MSSCPLQEIECGLELRVGELGVLLVGDAHGGVGALTRSLRDDKGKLEM